MHLQGSLAAVAAFGKPEYFPDVRRNIDREWIEQALRATGTATIRRRRLPAEQVVWLVIGMAAVPKSIDQRHREQARLALPGESPTVVPKCSDRAGTPRLGAEPMEWLFTRCADEWAHSSARRDAWRGWRFTGSTDRRCACPTPMRIARPSAARTDIAARARTRSPNGRADGAPVSPACRTGVRAVQRRRVHIRQCAVGLGAARLADHRRPALSGRVRADPLATGRRKPALADEGKKYHSWRVIERLGTGR